MSQLDDLYKEVILDHYRRPRHRGTLDTPPARTARGYNPLCGDEVDVYVIVDDDGRIVEVTTDGRGCSISQASASMMTEAVAGRTVAEATELFHRFKVMLGVDTDDALDASAWDPATDEGKRLRDAVSLQGVAQFPSRIKCATLGWNTLLDAADGDAPS
jgi:nitrogen fixation NifU-like protein